MGINGGLNHEADDRGLKPRLMYLKSVWCDRTNIDTSKRLSDVVRGTNLRTLTGTGRSTTTGALGMVMGIEYSQLTISKAIIRAFLQIDNSNNKKLVKALNCPRTMNDWVALRMTADRTYTYFFFNKENRISRSTRRDCTSGRLPYRAGDLRFTDGCKSSVGMGAGVYPLVAIPQSSKPN